MATIAELTAQKKRFKQAYERGEITKKQYTQAMVYTQTQLNKLKSQKIAAAKTGAVKPTTPKTVTYTRTPEQVARAVQGTTPVTVYHMPKVPEGYEVAKIEEVETDAGDKQLQVTFKPKPKPLGFAETAYLSVRTFQEIFLQKTGLKESQTAKTFLELGPLSQMYFATGIVGTLEADVHGIASLATSAYESARTGQLQYKPAWEARLAPTVIGGAVRGVFGDPSEALELHGRPVTYQFGAAFGEAGAMMLTGEAASRTWRFIRGVKVTKIGGATEKGVMVTTKKGVAAKRTTELILKTERAPSKYASYLDEMARYYTPEKIELGGTTKLFVKGAKEAQVVSKAALSFRKATPYVSAAKYAIQKQPSLLKRTGAKLGLTTIPKVTVTEKMLAKGVFFQTIQYKESTYTAIQIFGKIDKQIFIDLAKNVPPKIAQSFYYQMGGVSTQILRKVPSKTIPIITQVVGYSIPRGTGAFAVGAGATLLPKLGKKTRTKPITLTIPQVKRATPVLTMPKRLIQTPQPIDLRFSVTQRTSPLAMPRTAPITTPKQTAKTITETTPTPTIPTPTIPKKVLPYLPRGGGELSTKSFNRLFGRWFKRKHKVKTWPQMLGTFGLKAPKSLMKLGKMEVSKLSAFMKGFSLGKPKRKQGKRKKKRRKRKR